MRKRELANGTRLFLVDDISPEDLCMLQALYSRSAESVEIHLNKIYSARRDAIRDILKTLRADVPADIIHEVMDLLSGNAASARAGAFMKKFLVNYGHKSIGDCGSTTLFIENVSLLAAKAIQDSPLYKGQETSTRYIDMSRQGMVDPVGTVESKAILDGWMGFYTKHQGAVAAEIRKRYPRQSGEDEKAYEGAVKARTFDVMRAFIPAAAMTQLSLHTDLRQAGDRLTALHVHPAAEVRNVAHNVSGMLSEQYTSSGNFGGEAAVSGIGSAGDGMERLAWESEVSEEFTYEPPDSFEYFSTNINAEDLADNDSEEFLFSRRPRGCVLPHWLASLGQNTWLFDLDFGSFRDIQRHRNGVCRMPLLTTNLGFETWYLDQLPADVRAEAEALISAQKIAIDKISVDAVTRQYYTSLGFKVSCLVSYALPATIYVLELRSGKMVHPTLRKVVHKMIGDFKDAFPNVPLHVDMSEDGWSVRRGTQTITERNSPSE